MKAQTPVSSSLLPLSSCMVILLTTVIGNFGVSDADVVIRQDGPHLHHRRGSGSNRGGSGSLSSNSESAINSEYFQQKSVVNRHNKNELVVDDAPSSSSSSSAASDAGAVQEQLYFRLVPTSSRQSSPSSFHKEGEEKDVDELSLLGEAGAGIDLGYPLPLSIDDYWALTRDRLLDQLVIRALANPDEWTELRKTFEKVDGDLKALLSLEKGKNQAIPDGTTNSSLGYGVSYGGATSSRSSSSTTSISSTSSSSSSSSPSSPSSTQNQEEQQEHHHGLKWKFTYHRVRDLNAAGQPRSRGIAAVVSLDAAENESKNGTTSGNTFGGGDAPLKTSKGSLFPFVKDGGVVVLQKEEVVKVVGAAELPSSSRFDDPIEALTPRGGGTHATSTTTTTTTSTSSNGNNNIISNSFSRFGNKGKHVDLASDKRSGGSGSSSSRSSGGGDNSRKSSSSSVSNSMPKSALVLPTEMESQGNEPNSHKIQWDPRHGQGGGGDEVVLPHKEVRPHGQQGDGGNDHHHPARHHHHRDHHYHKNYHHHQSKHHFQHQMSSSFGGRSGEDAPRPHPAELSESLPVPERVVDEHSSNNHQYQNHLRSQYQHHNHHHHDQHIPRQEENERNHHHFLNKKNHHHHHRDREEQQQSKSWKRFHLDNPAKDK